jgi:tRNA G18 (ribose-2'-O)-methylase SpoU
LVYARPRGIVNGMPAEPIESLEDPRVADYRNLPDPVLRRDRGIFVAEGRLIVRRLLASRFPVRSVLATPAALDGLRDVLAEGVPVYVARAEVLRGIVGVSFHRGCLAAGERVPEPALQGLLDHGRPRRLLLVLEGISNPDNVGGVFRNALAFGVEGVLLAPGCGDPLYRKAIRVAMGGSLLVPFAALSDWPADLGRIRAAGFTLAALTPDAALDIATWEPPARLALLLGAEGNGLGAATRAAADVALRIAMAPGADALNVATAAGIALHRLGGRW